MKERLVLLEVFGDGFVLARRTETGQFTPVRMEMKRDKFLKLNPENLGHLRNVAGWVAFKLQQQNPSKFGLLDTGDPLTIAEGKPSDSLRIILGRKRSEENLQDLSKVIVREFGNVGIGKEEEESLLQNVLFVLEKLADIAYKK